MAIASMVKVNLFGTADQREVVLDALQDLGCVHLLDLGERVEPGPPTPDISSETLQAVKYLRACPIRRRPVRTEHGFQFEEVVHETLRIEQRQHQLQDERDELLPAVRGLSPWGDFRLPELGELGDLRLWFYIVPHFHMRSVLQRDEIRHVASRDSRFTYLVIVSPTEPEGMPVPRVRLDDRPLSELRHRLEAVELELEDLHWRRVALTRWNELLTRTIDLAHDLAMRQRAAKQAWSDPAMFVLQGWAPHSEADRTRRFAREHALGLTVERPGDTDSPPTLLRNSGLMAGGQGAVTFYTTPAYRAWDPSSVVFVSFSVFFAMIMADAGYAFVLGGLLLILWRRLGRSPDGRQLRLLSLAVVVTSVAYGVAVGSYFGLPPTKGSLLQTLHLIDAADTTLMMQISIGLGTAHLALANLALAWNRRRSPQMFASLGWVAMFLGGLSLGFGKSGMEPQADLVRFGTIGLITGVISVLLFSSERTLFSLRLSNHLWRLLDGLQALTAISRAFGDVLSYLRLFALGLASAQLAATFNELTYKASCCVGIGSALAIVAVVFGHGLNFTLAIMSGVVHGLRLNCIEFFGWGLPDEGYPFEPFCKKAI